MIRFIRKHLPPIRLTCRQCGVVSKFQRGTPPSMMYPNQIHKPDCGWYLEGGENEESSLDRLELGYKEEA